MQEAAVELPDAAIVSCPPSAVCRIADVEPGPSQWQLRLNSRPLSRVCDDSQQGEGKAPFERRREPESERPLLADVESQTLQSRTFDLNRPNT
jgi:hypothetical protein